MWFIVDDEGKGDLGTIKEMNEAKFAGIVQALTQECSVMMPTLATRKTEKTALTSEKRAAIQSGGMSSTGEKHVVQPIKANPLEVINKKITSIVK